MTRADGWPAEPAESAHRCDVEGCSRTFTRATALNDHIRSKHTHEKPYACPLPTCDARFSRSDSQRKHIARVHQGRRDFVCGGEKDPHCNCACGRAYATRNELNRHHKTSNSRQEAATSDNQVESSFSTSAPSSLQTRHDAREPFDLWQDPNLGLDALFGFNFDEAETDGLVNTEMPNLADPWQSLTMESPDFSTYQASRTSDISVNFNNATSKLFDLPKAADVKVNEDMIDILSSDYDVESFRDHAEVVTDAPHHVVLESVATETASARASGDTTPLEQFYVKVRDLLDCDVARQSSALDNDHPIHKTLQQLHDATYSVMITQGKEGPDTCCTRRLRNCVSDWADLGHFNPSRPCTPSHDNGVLHPNRPDNLPHSGHRSWNSLSKIQQLEVEVHHLKRELDVCKEETRQAIRACEKLAFADRRKMMQLEAQVAQQEATIERVRVRAARTYIQCARYDLAASEYEHLALLKKDEKEHKAKKDAEDSAKAEDDETMYSTLR